MCGIAGLSLSEPIPGASDYLGSMVDSVTHRGPDSEGLFTCPSGETHLGFRRLAIRDLHVRANQPMQSASGRTVIAFNGEIYNTDELGTDRSCGARLRTTSDTEVFLETFERYGESILSRLNGMFAVALYDTATRTLTLARDRMGKKPLYLFEGDGFLAFASELRALRGLGLEPDPNQAPYYFQFGYLPSPFTFFKSTSQVCPGELVVIRRGRVVSRRRFHDFTDLRWGKFQTVDLDQLDELLADAVSIRTLSDVSVGAFLSGGVDSSLVAAQLKNGGYQTIPTYTVAFNDSRYNEATYAKQVADHLGLPHTEIRIDESRLPELVNDYLDCYEQPYADSSGLPSMLLCQEVKNHVTVALSGDGGDEFFGGYARYDWYRQALLAQRMPSLGRKFVQGIVSRFGGRCGLRIQRLLETHDEPGLYSAIARSWTLGSTSQLMPDVPLADQAPQQLFRDVFSRLDCDPLSKAACCDAIYYIPDDLQVKMDRASMRVSLEVRCPLLDFRFAQFGAELSTGIKFQKGKKSVLKALLGRHLPRRLFERPKRGFSVPVSDWIQGPLWDQIHGALTRQSFRECGWLDFEKIETILREFRKGQLQLAGPLWLLFVLAMTMSKAQTTATHGTVPSLDTKQVA